MMINDENCNNEKYFNSIKYIYHLEESEAKKDYYLNELINYNIVLAAICLASDKKNLLREEKLVEFAKKCAENFTNKDQSSKALLALSELKEYTIILTIFNGISEPQSNHKQVLRKVFQQADESVFLKFIESFSNYQFFNLITTEFLFYPKKIIPNQETLKIIKVFIKHLHEKGLIGFIRLFLEKYELVGHVSYFFDDNVENLITNFLASEKQKEVYLGYSILTYGNNAACIEHSKVITMLCQPKKKKVLKLAIDFALSNNVYNNIKLNETIRNIIISGQKRALKNLLFLLKNRLYEFCKKIPELNECLIVEADTQSVELDKFEKQRVHKEARIENIESIIWQYNSNEGVDRFINELAVSDRENLNIEKHVALEKFWLSYFNNSDTTLKSIPIEVFIERSCSLFQKDLRTVCHVLRNFECKGQFLFEDKFGFYVRPLDFRSLKTLFLHRNMCFNDFIINDAKGEITFRIVGYNLETKRINVSLLKVDEIISKASNNNK